MPRGISRSILACFLTAGLASGTAARAAEPASRHPDAQAIRAAAMAYLDAKQRGDGAAMRQLWTADGDYIDASGNVYKARDVIPQQTSQQQTPTAQHTDNAKLADAAEPESSLRFVTPDVAIEDGAAEIGALADGTVLSGRYTAVWVKRDGRWLLDSLRDAVSATATKSKLAPLEWLIGEWVGVTDEGVTLVSSYWSDAGRYIVREFLVRADGREVLSGTQRIGWDPVAGKIKSWTFDSQGGMSEGYWREEDGSWILDSKEVLPDGKRAAASVAHTPREDGSFTWEARSAEVDGQSLPPARVEYRRAPEEAEEAPEEE